ncbi:LysR family transcriptional regulator [Rhodoblastus sp.]|uniref:LysR family transcriptional regulator n=1 Tax=Rhodoblastus sp. TaxID=1962975 RepID=UPI003F970D2C
MSSKFVRRIDYSILRFLHYVFAACEHGSFHRGALALGVEASALSRRIHDIEDALGFAIFRRCHNGVLLTEQGGSWVNDVRPHYEALRDKTTHASLGARENAILQIGISAPLGSGAVVELLRRVGEDRSAASSFLVDGPCCEHRLAVLRRQLDVAFVWDRCLDKGCRSEILWREQLFVCLPIGHPLLAREELRWSDLQSERLLVPRGKNGPLFDSCLLERIGETGAGPEIEICDAAQVTLLAKIMFGAGFGIAGDALARSVLPGVAWRPLAGENSAIPVKAIWLASNSNPLLHRLLVRARNMVENREQR